MAPLPQADPHRADHDGADGGRCRRAGAAHDGRGERGPLPGGEVQRHLSSPEDVFETLERNLRQNTGVRAYFAAFEPGFFAGEGHWFCANVYWDGKNIVKQHIGSQQQDYLQRKWYKKGILDKDGLYRLDDLDARMAEYEAIEDETTAVP